MAEPNESNNTENIFDVLQKTTEEQVKAFQDTDEKTPTFVAPSTPSATQPQAQIETELEPGFKGVTEPNNYVSMPMGVVDPVLGTTVSRVFYTDAQRRKLQDSRQDPQTKYETIIAPLTKEQREHMAKVAPEEVDEDYLQKGLGLVNYYLSPFNLPESVAWTGMSYVAQALPNPGSYLGDMAQSSFSAMYPYLSGQVIFSAKNAFDADAPKDPEAEKAFAEAEGELSNKIYEDIATGKVYDRIIEGASYEGTLVDDVFGEVPMARGAEILDGIISKEEAQNLYELADKAGDKAAAEYYAILTDDFSRELIGFAGEVIGDPLNMFGMAAGSKLIKVGGAQYTIQGDAAKAHNALTNTALPSQKASDIVVGTLQRDQNSVEQLRKIIEKEQKLEKIHQAKLESITEKLQNPDTIIETAKADVAEHQQAIQNLIDQARAADTPADQAKAAMDAKRLKALEQTKQMEAERLASIDNVKDAQKFMTNVAKREASIVAMHKRQVAQMSKLLEDGYDASKTMQTAGAFRFHIPFGKKTYNVGKSTFKIKPIANVDTATSIANRTVGNVDDLAKLNKTTPEGLELMVRNGERITVGIGGGGIKGIVPQPVLTRLGQVKDNFSPVNINAIKSRVIDAGGSTNTLTAGERFVFMLFEQNILGARDFQKFPRYAFQQLSTFLGTRYFEPWFANREMEQAMQYFRTRGADYNKIRNFFSGKTTNIIRLRRTAPELWDNYQNALVKYNRSVAVSGEKAITEIQRLVRLADDVARLRIANGTAEEGLDGLKVLEEAARYREKGVAFPEELAPLRDTYKKIIDDIKDSASKDEEEVRQALQNIARFVSTDTEVVRDFSNRLKTVREELTTITKSAVEKTERDITRLKKLKSLFPRAAKQRNLKKQIKDLERQEKSLKQVLDNYQKAIKNFPDNKNFTDSIQESITTIQDKLQEFKEADEAFEAARPKIIAERIKVGADGTFERPLEEWEMDLWNRFTDASEGYEETDVLKAVFGVFKRDAVDYAEIAEKFRGTKAVSSVLPKDAQYPTVIGTRFEDIPEDIQPLVDELSLILDSYTEMYKQNGFDFIKDPEELMKAFGVLEYVPHMRSNKATDVATVDSAKFAREERKISGGTDQKFAEILKQDAGRFRSLTGSIDEINALVRYQGDQWEFTISPELLHSRLLQASKGTASKEMLLSFLRTGVARTFRSIEEARGSGFVPLLERSSSGLNKEVMLYGSREQLIDAAGRPTDQEPFVDIIEALMTDEVLTSWTSEMREFDNVAKVEQSVGIIRAVQAKALQGAPELQKFLINGEPLDVQKRWNEFTSIRREAYLTKAKEEFDEVSKKVQALTAKGKPTPPTLQKRFDRLDQSLDPKSEKYKLNDQRFANAAWKDVSDEISETLSEIVKGEFPEIPNIKRVLREQNRYRLGIEPITKSDLQMYFDPGQAVDKLYIPETVAESLRMMTAKTFVGEPGTWQERIYKYVKMLNNFWKLRMTVISPMFTTRNFFGNLYSNALDFGVGGVLDPFTNIKAGRLAVLIEYHSKYGSLEKASKALKAPRKPNETIAQSVKRKLKAKELAFYWKGKDKNIDLGDGVIRSWDESLQIMSDNGVLSGTANYRLDFEDQLNEMLEAKHKLSMAEAEGLSAIKAKKILSKAEDFTVVAVSAAATGGIPIAMTKDFGSAIARRFENQARAVNFIANLKRGGTVEDAVANVNRFLLDYNDLTPRQKDYMRVLNPFFTWNFKNFRLMTEMMVENPVYYSTLNRAFYNTMPMVAQILEDESEEEYERTSFEYMRYKTMQRVKYYPDYKMYRIRIPGAPFGLPQGFDIEGLGLPIESWGEYMQMVENLTRLTPYVGKGSKVGEKPYAGAEGLMARTHFLARLAYMQFTNRDPFYGESLDDPKMRDATDVVNIIHNMRQFPELKPLTEYVQESMGISTVVRGGSTNYFYDTSSNKFFLAKKYTPFSIDRAIREGAPITDFNNKSLMTPEGRWDDSVTPEMLSLRWRYFNAFTGAKIKKQANTDYLIQRHREKQNELLLDEMARRGLSFKKESSIIRK